MKYAVIRRPFHETRNITRVKISPVSSLRPPDGIMVRICNPPPRSFDPPVAQLLTK